MTGSNRTIAHDSDGASAAMRPPGRRERSQGSEAGVSTFTLAGANGSIKGWVLSPVGAEIVNTGDPLQIEVTGAEADVWIVMALYQGSEPVAAISGMGLDAELSFGERSVRYDGASDRIVATGGGVPRVVGRAATRAARPPVAMTAVAPAIRGARARRLMP